MELHKIIVIGPPGSGKTYLSNILGDCFHLPVFHLDDIYYQDDKPIKAKAFDVVLSDILQKDKWIIDGHYFDSLEKRLSKCEMIYFLDLSKEEIYQSLLERKDSEKYKARGIIDFEHWYNHYLVSTREEIYKELENSNKKVYIFKTRKEVNEYIQKNKQ